jgi:uncharacterized damage-inducible protein DinB
MGTLAIPRPTADESAPYYQTYIGKVSGENIVEQLATQLAEVERLFASTDDRSALARYAPGKWSVKEVLGHLADVERIFGYRLLRVSRGDPTPLPSFDENAYVPAARFDEQPLTSLMRGFQTVRQSTITLIESIPPESWSLRGEASGKAISARALAYILVGHVTHHLGVLRERYHLGRSTVHS